MFLAFSKTLNKGYNVNVLFSAKNPPDAILIYNR